jgi:hypothetical protein
VLQLKEAVATKTRIEVQKIRLLWKKKPVVDSKILKDLVGEGDEAGMRVEFTIMIIGMPAFFFLGRRERNWGVGNGG